MKKPWLFLLATMAGSGGEGAAALLGAEEGG